MREDRGTAPGTLPDSRGLSFWGEGGSQTASGAARCRPAEAAGGGGSSHTRVGTAGEGQPPRGREEVGHLQASAPTSCPPSTPPPGSEQLWYSSYAVLLGQEPSRRSTFGGGEMQGPLWGSASNHSYKSGPARSIPRPCTILFSYASRGRRGWPWTETSPQQSPAFILGSGWCPARPLSERPPPRQFYL